MALLAITVNRTVADAQGAELQWNLSIGTQLAVLYREVSLIQR